VPRSVPIREGKRGQRFQKIVGKNSTIQSEKAGHFNILTIPATL